MSQLTKDLVFHSPHKQIAFGDSKATRRWKRRRATFVIQLNEKELDVRFSICNPKDNFSKKFGVDEAEKFQLKTIEYPEDLAPPQFRDFALKIGKGLMKSFDVNQSRYVNKKIEANKIINKKNV